jgi:hypothetical protein
MSFWSVRLAKNANDHIAIRKKASVKMVIFVFNERH